MGSFSCASEKVKPLLVKFKGWLETNLPLTPPKGLLGQSMGYTLANWKKLIM
jgi:hypothetical protein